MRKHMLFAASAAGLFMASAASAEVAFTAGTDLNLRSGPGGNYEVLGVIPAAQPVMIDGCLAEANWCQVNYDGKTGWAASDYLTVAGVPAADAGVVVLSQRPADVEVKTVTYTDASDQAASAAAGAAAGATAGAMLGGPPGAMIGLILGNATGAAVAEPTTEVVTYVEQNPVEPMLLDGEIVVGAGIPAEVTLAPVPESEFSYLYLNGQPVIVSNTDRTIVKIIR